HPQKRRKAAFEGVCQYISILPRHADARCVEHCDHEGHQAPGTLADGVLHRSHGLAPDRLADGFEDQDLEEDGADEHDGGKQMQGDEDEMAHGGSPPTMTMPCYNAAQCS